MKKYKSRLRARIARGWHCLLRFHRTLDVYERHFKAPLPSPLWTQLEIRCAECDHDFLDEPSAPGREVYEEL